MNKIEKSDTFTKNRAFAVLGYSYSGTAFVCNVFDCFQDAEDFIKNEQTGWTYVIERTFMYTRNLPF